MVVNSFLLIKFCPGNGDIQLLDCSATSWSSQFPGKYVQNSYYPASNITALIRLWQATGKILQTA